MMFWMCPALVPPLKAKVTTRTTTQITSRSGVATKDMSTMPMAGTRKARAVFTWIKMGLFTTKEETKDLLHVQPRKPALGNE